MKRSLAMLLFVALVSAGCGGSSDEASAGPTAAVPEATEPAGATPGGGGGAALGSCHVDVTGARTLSWDSPGGMAAVGVQYWLSEQALATVPADTFFLIVNCNSDSGLVTFAAGDAASTDTVPLAPARYDLPGRTSGLAGSVIVAGVNVTEDDEVLWGINDGGVLEITAFDDRHITGTFAFTAGDVFGADDGELIVTGSFDYANPN